MSLSKIPSVQHSIQELLDNRKQYLLAFSSGGDSVFLLYQLFFFYGRDLKNRISIAYINYHDSPFVAEEERIFFHYVSLFGLSYFKKDVRYRKNYGNFEEWARNYRYSYFKKVCTKNGFAGVITAHQKTDFIETYRLQMERKNLPRHYGLAPLSDYKGRPICRPMLSISKERLTDELKAAGILFYDDVTNYNRKKKRNKIRTEIKEEDRDREIKEAEKKNLDLLRLYLEFKSLSSPYSYSYYQSKTEDEQKRLCFFILQSHLPKKDYSSGIGKKRFSFLKKRETGVLKLTERINLYRWKDGFFLFSDLSRKSYQYHYKKKKKYRNTDFIIDLSDPSFFNRKDLPVTIRNYHPGDRLGTDLIEKDVYSLLRKQGVPSFLIPVYPIFIQKGSICCVPFYKDLIQGKIPLLFLNPPLFIKKDK